MWQFRIHILSLHLKLNGLLKDICPWAFYNIHPRRIVIYLPRIYAHLKAWLLDTMDPRSSVLIVGCCYREKGWWLPFMTNWSKGGVLHERRQRILVREHMISDFLQQSWSFPFILDAIIRNLCSLTSGQTSQNAHQFETHFFLDQLMNSQGGSEHGPVLQGNS